MAVVYKGSELEFFFAGVPIATGTVNNINWGDIELPKCRPHGGVTCGTVEITSDGPSELQSFFWRAAHPPVILHQEDWGGKLSLSGDGDGDGFGNGRCAGDGYGDGGGTGRGHGDGDGYGDGYGDNGFGWGYGTVQGAGNSLGGGVGWGDAE